ncbi:DNA-formamidopyrimidine glycosylase family protein [Agromyces sp. G08B096]|uniref:DNA-formamidopyrimidine glycosylase family protein n=1 Tax=Agromyces sp. G08B096 TaxID=3156399 RepID=A0AAU7WDE6_9MICO
MPESPEVQALAEELDERLRGRTITGVDVLEFRAAKTRSRPPSSLEGERIAGVTRHGKLLDVAVEAGAHLVVSLGRHGWGRWADETADPAPGERPPALVSIGFDEGPALELTDAGGWVSLGLWVVDDPREVPAIAKLGPDPADESFTRTDFDEAFVGRRKQTKAVLQEQESLAGIGNAYSDEILHLAKVSPVAHASTLTGEELDRLFAATTGVVRTAIAERRGIPIDQQKAAKVAAMRVHGRTGEACPVCGDEIRDFSFASTTAQYCPTCQTGGERLPLRPA